MTRQGHILFGLFVTGVTAVALWASVAIPVQTQRQVRGQLTGLVAQVKRSVGSDGCPVNVGGRLESRYLARVAVHPRQCAVTLQLSEGAPVAHSVRGATITLTRDKHADLANRVSGARTWRCIAEGGHGAGQADFPVDCRYRTQTPLL